jgi:hypothetical protein
VEEILRENYTFITKSVEVMAAVTGLLVLKKYKHTVTKYFIYFLVYVAILEILGSYPRYLANYEFLSDFKAAIKGTFFEKNYWWYTIFWAIGGTLFYSYYFQKVLKTKSYKNILKYASILFLISSIVYIVTHWHAFFVSSSLFIRIFEAIIILCCSMFYFIEILKDDRVLTFYRSINFIISATILIWWLILTPLLFYDQYYLAVDWNFIFLKWQIYLFANIFMYSLFTFGLIWCKPQND